MSSCWNPHQSRESVKAHQLFTISRPNSCGLLMETCSTLLVFSVIWVVSWIVAMCFCSLFFLVEVCYIDSEVHFIPDAECLCLFFFFLPNYPQLVQLITQKHTKQTEHCSFSVKSHHDQQCSFCKVSHRVLINSSKSFFLNRFYILIAGRTAIL